MQTFSEQLKRRRRERRMSQLDLSLEADVSGRHIAFLETGRSRPSRAMVLRLAEALQAPLPDRNILLTAAGFAPEYPERRLNDAALAPVREAMSRLLRQQEPYPAVVLDRAWRIVEANRIAAIMFAPVLEREDRSLLAYVNETPAYRATIENWAEIAPAMLARLKLERGHGPENPALDKEIARLETLVAETCAAPESAAAPPSDALFLTPILRVGETRLTLFSTIAHFGAAREIAVADLQIELFFPLDAETEAFFQALAAG